MGKTFETLDSVHRLIQELSGLLLALVVVFVVSVQLPETRLGTTKLQATSRQT
jgi:succinate dehydrogenase hydrophobic anchor subunit